MEANEEIAKVAGADKADTQIVQSDLDKQYAEMLKKDQEALEARQRGEAALDFDKVRKLGFATNKDIEEYVKGMYGKFVSEIEAIRKQNTELREWVMRAKAQGITGNALDQKSNDSSEVSDYLKPYMRDKPRR